MASLKSGLPSGAPKECNQNKPPIQKPATMARRVMRGRSPLRLDWNDMVGVAFYQFGLIGGPAAWAATPPQDNYPIRPDFRTLQAQILENAKILPFFFGLGYGTRMWTVAATDAAGCSGASMTVAPCPVRTKRQSLTHAIQFQLFSFYPKGATSERR